jgi:hypothetical protein
VLSVEPGAGVVRVAVRAAAAGGAIAVDVAAGLGLELVLAPWIALRLQGEATGASGDAAFNAALGVMLFR